MRILFFLILCGFLVEGKTQVISLQEDKVNVVTLLVDYSSNQYEGGNLSIYDCLSCTNDSLPFAVDYQSPGDFGGIKFQLPNLDTVFDATIIWMGLGEIAHPSSFSQTYPFNVSTVNSFIDEITYFNMEGDRTLDAQFINEANAALEQIYTLPIYTLFHEIEVKIGVYLYAPTVGMFDPAVAKWVIFLYANNLKQNSISENSKEELFVYPNPFTSVLKIPNGNGNFKIKDLSGKLLLEDKINTSKEIDLSFLKEGTYLLEVEENSKKLVKKVYKTN